MSGQFGYRLTPKVQEVRFSPQLNNNPVSEDKKLRRPGTAAQQKSSCIVCNRPKQVVLCSQCGSTFSGRVTGQCIQHPAAIFLLDMTSCPHCKAGHEALKEYPEARQRLDSVKKRKCETE